MMMQKVICDGCGSALKMEKVISHLTCSICASVLQVEKSGLNYATSLIDGDLQYKPTIEDELKLKLPGENEKLLLNKSRSRPKPNSNVERKEQSIWYIWVMEFLMVIFVGLTIFNVLYDGNVFCLIISFVLSLYTLIEIIATMNEEE